MTEAFRAIRQGAVLDVVFDPRAEANGQLLDATARAALLRLVQDLQPDVGAVLIRAGVRPFAGQSSLPHPDDKAAPDLCALCAAVEGASVPVFFLIDGTVSGALAEVALAAHARLSSPEGRLSIGALSLGLISGAGGTQRLAGLIGAEQALRVMRGGMAVAGPEALALGLVDAVVEGADRAALAAVAVARAAQGIDRAAAPGLRDGRGFLAAVAEARAAMVAPTRAEAALVDCIEAAMLLPRDQGLTFEATVAADLAATPEAAALCHIFRAERQATAVPEALAGFAPARVAHLGLAGAPMPLVGIVLTALSRGVAVTLSEGDRGALVAFLKAIAARQEAAVQAGQLSEAQRDADWARLVPAGDASALAPCDLVIAGEGVAVPPGSAARAVLVLGRAPLPRGAFRLVLSGRLAELALPEGAVGQAAGQAHGFLRRLGLIVVLTGVQSAAGISGRLAGASGAAVRAMAALGVPPEAICTALADFGLPRPALPEASGVPVRAMPHAEIVNRWLGAMANEGARMLAAGMVRSAHDIDLVAVHGLGFPRARGGPLHQADRRGLLIVRRDLSQWAEDAEVWRAVPAWDGFVSVGRGFAGSLRTGSHP